MACSHRDVHARWQERNGKDRAPEAALMEHVKFLAPERFYRDMAAGVGRMFVIVNIRMLHERRLVPPSMAQPIQRGGRRCWKHGLGNRPKSAQEEFDVQMVDRELQWVERGQSIIANFLEEAVERRIFSPGQVEAIQGRISGVVGVENTAENTDLVIEAVFEDFDVKTAVFNTLDEACGENTILASNTSSLSVNALAEATGRADRFVGLHFFYHPAKNRLVEVIPAKASSQATIDKVVQYCKMLGKVVIVCADRPGFVVNRFFVPWLNEAVSCSRKAQRMPLKSMPSPARRSALVWDLRPDEPHRPSHCVALHRLLG